MYVDICVYIYNYTYHVGKGAGWRRRSPHQRNPECWAPFLESYTVGSFGASFFGA